MMAAFSVRTRPSSSSAGTKPRGLIARNSGVRCAPSKTGVRTASNGSPVSSSTMWEASEHAPGL